MLQNILNDRIFIEPWNQIMCNGVINKHLIHKPNANHVKQLLSFYSRFYEVTMLESTNVIGERKMQMYL